MCKGQLCSPEFSPRSSKHPTRDHKVVMPPKGVYRNLHESFINTQYQNFLVTSPEHQGWSQQELATLCHLLMKKMQEMCMS